MRCRKLDNIAGKIVYCNKVYSTSCDFILLQSYRKLNIKMYNGIGLSTPRGSGTSGHVQRNFAAVPRREKEKKTEETTAEPTIRMADPEILEHNRKRKIEIECIELEDKLEDQGYTQEQIDKEVDAFRKKKLEDYERSCRNDELGDSNIQDSHQRAEAQHKRNANLENAFGLSTNQPPPIASPPEEES